MKKTLVLVAIAMPEKPLKPVNLPVWLRVFPSPGYMGTAAWPGAPRAS